MAVAINDVVKLAEQRRRFFVRQVKVHHPNIGALMIFAESAHNHPPGRRAEVSRRLVLQRKIAKRRTPLRSDDRASRPG
jgi:hypothetical protein